MKADELKQRIRDVPDFPKAGILFKDITPLLGDPVSFRLAVDALAERYRQRAIDQVVSIEARGFILGAALAYKLQAGIVPVRKFEKLPYKTLAASYQLEYGTDRLEIHADAIQPGQRVIIVDDLLATGGTAAAVTGLVQRLSGEIAGLAFLIELTALRGREKLPDLDVFSLIQY